jgi:hypothetical protein
VCVLWRWNFTLKYYLDEFQASEVYYGSRVCVSFNNVVVIRLNWSKFGCRPADSVIPPMQSSELRYPLSLNSFKESPAWETDDHSAGQDVFHLSRNPNVRYRLHRSLPFCFFKVCFHSIFPSMPMSSSSFRAYILHVGLFLILPYTCLRLVQLFYPPYL